MNDYLLYALLISGCIPIYLVTNYYLNKGSIILQISKYLLPLLLTLCYTSYCFALTKMYWLFIPALGAIFASFYFLTRFIKKPILKIKSTIEDMAKGNLNTQEIDDLKDHNDELGAISTSLIEMNSSIKEVVTGIQEISQHLKNSSLEVSNSSTEISKAANMQASSAEEISASMEEMASIIDNNSVNSQKTREIASISVEKVREGSNTAKNTAELMREIAGKIQIINDIAFQTNILALNAAVEAARAGDQGKGFAVVASEVRKLAERSKDAAENINDITRKGINVAEQANDELIQTVPEIEQTQKLVSEIAAASNEQSSGVSQINNALQQLNMVSQNNATSSEELSSMSEELIRISDTLLQKINFFSINNN
ncbi:MAG: methyl-accepting chemotaxis protein [Bacteroidota bacterium]|nr:methyl-accepting chemotaxis protein [Bacteroidota bacterium]